MDKKNPFILCSMFGTLHQDKFFVCKHLRNKKNHIPIHHKVQNSIEPYSVHDRILSSKNLGKLVCGSTAIVHVKNDWLTQSTKWLT